MSTAARRQVKLADGVGCGIVTLLLPVSKTDQLALGTERTHGCSCPSPLCPLAAVAEVCGDLRSVVEKVQPLGVSAGLEPEDAKKLAREAIEECLGDS
eukprot:6467277-Amphidinium_carterae.1